MTEENLNTEATETVVENETPVNEEPTVTVAEMKRRLAKEQEKFQSQIDELKTNQNDLVKQAVEEAEKRSKMSAKELEELRQKDIQRQIEERDARIAELELENTRRELKDGAIEILSERKLPVNERVLKLVVKDTGEATETAITDLAEIIKEIKNEFASTTAPITSGGVGANGIETDIFKILDDAGK